MNSNQTIEYFINMWYLKTTSSELTDCLFLYVYTPINVIGFFLNLTNFLIFSNEEFNTNLYKYLRFYCLDSALLNFISSFAVLYKSTRLSAFSKVYFSVFIFSYIYSDIVNTIYFINSILDLIILIDRIALFKPKFKFDKFNPYFICIIITIICTVINIPYFMLFTPVYFYAEFNNQTVTKFYYYGLSKFGSSDIGKNFSYFLNGVRDAGTLLVEFILNIVSLILLKEYLNKKKKLIKISSNATKHSNLEIKSVNQNGSRLNSDHTTPTLRPKEKNISNRELKANAMVIFMCFMSSTEHLLILIAIISKLLFNGFFSSILIFLGNFGISLKHAMSFLTFYLFNKNFARKFNSYINEFKYRK